MDIDYCTEFILCENECSDETIVQWLEQNNLGLIIQIFTTESHNWPESSIPERRIISKWLLKN